MTINEMQKREREREREKANVKSQRGKWLMYVLIDIPSIFCKIFFTLCLHPSQCMFTLRTHFCMHKQSHNPKQNKHRFHIQQKRNWNVTRLVTLSQMSKTQGQINKPHQLGTKNMEDATMDWLPVSSRILLYSCLTPLTEQKKVVTWGILDLSSQGEIEVLCLRRK